MSDPILRGINEYFGVGSKMSLDILVFSFNEGACI